MMTKKDYELIAGVLQDADDFADGWRDPAGREAVRYVIDLMAARLADAYPKFDRERFLRACQPESVRGSR